MNRLRRRRSPCRIQNSAVRWILLDDLNTLPRDFRTPILFVDLRIELASAAMRLAGLSSTWPIRYSVRAMLSRPTANSGRMFLRVNRAEQIETGSVFQELGRESSVRAEQQRSLSVDVDECRDAAPTSEATRPKLCRTPWPDAARRRLGCRTATRCRSPGPSVPLPLGNLGFLQQRKCSAAGAEEHELRLDSPVLAGLFVSDVHLPQVACAVQIRHATVIMDCKSFPVAQRIEQHIGEGAVVDVRAGHHPRRRDDFAWIAALHDEGNPIVDLLLVRGIFHPPITVVGRERLQNAASETPHCPLQPQS